MSVIITWGLFVEAEHWTTHLMWTFLCVRLSSPRGGCFFSWSKWFPHWPEKSASWLTETTLAASDCHDVLLDLKSKNCASASTSWSCLCHLIVATNDAHHFNKVDAAASAGAQLIVEMKEHLNPRWTLVSPSCGHHYYKMLVSVEMRMSRFHLNRRACKLLSGLRGI